MRKVIIGTILALVLVATEGFSETRPADESAAGHLLTCPHCGFAITNSVVVSSPVMATKPVVAVSPAITTTNQAVRDWKSSVYGGFSAQSGNTTASAYNYGGDYSRSGKIYRGKLKVDGKYSKVDETVTISKSEVSGEMRRMLNERWFSYGMMSGLHDGLKDLSYRVKTGPGLGYYFVDSKELKVDVSSGPLYVIEKKAGTRSGYLAWRGAQEIDWKITSTFRWWALTEAVVEATDISAYVLAVKTGVENKINNNLSLLVTVEDDYDSHPEAKGNIEKNDFEVSTGIRYAF